MKLIPGNAYNYHYNVIAECGEHKGKRIEGDIILTFIEIEQGLLYTCDNCGRERKNTYVFKDQENNYYNFGSECFKKVIKECIE